MPISEIVPEETINKMIEEIVVVCKIVQKHLEQAEPSTKI